MAVKASVTITISKYRDTDSITRYYKLQASTAAAPAVPTTLTPSGWSTSEPTYTSGSTNTLYYTDCVVFSDGTFQYTDDGNGKAVKSSSYEAAKEAYNKAQAAQNTINNMEIGGRNYLIGSEKWNCFKDSEGIQITDDIAIKTGNGTNSNLKLISVTPGEQISISVDIKADVNFTPSDGFILHQWNSDSTRVSTSWWKEPLTTEWKRYKTTITVPNDSNIKYYGLGIRNNQSHTLYFRHCKIEHGNKPTDWTPAPEDIDNAIAKTVKQVDVEYYLSTSSTSVTGGSWSTTAPAWVNGKYMWSRQKVTYVDNTTATRNQTCIAGAKGATGSPGGTGATGTGVESITEEYYLSTSKSSQTGGSWSTTPPTWQTGKYIWTRSKIIYKNPTSTAYTTPVCSSEWEAINDMEIGGRNLLVGSNKYREDEPVGFINTVANDAYKPLTDMKFIPIPNEYYIIQVKSDHEVTSSHGYKNDNIGKFTIWFYIRNIGTTKSWGNFDSAVCFTSSDNTNDKKYLGSKDDTYYWLYKIPNNVLDICIRVNTYADSENPVTIKWWDFKIEKGNKPTDWTPAPEDTDADIDQVNAAVNEAHSIASNASTLANTAYTMINSLNASITNFVSGGGKYVRMDQSAEGGMQLNMGELSSALDDMIERLENTLDETEAAKLKSDIQSAMETINGRTKYITADDKGPGGSPRIVLGDTSSPFKVEITNQSINFLQNGEVIAYANGTAFFNLRTVVQQDVQIGLGPGFIWKTRESGNMGLTWVPASS